MKMIAAVLALALLAPASAFAQTGGERAIERMREADANHDGAITRAEFVAYRASQFTRIDRNQDGFLTQQDAPPFARLAPAAFNPAAMTEQFDVNNDGRVSRAEFVNGPTLMFDRADANHDNVVVRAELDAAAAAARANR